MRRPLLKLPVLLALCGLAAALGHAQAPASPDGPGSPVADNPAATVQAKLRTIVIPQILLANAPIAGVALTLSELSRQHDPVAVGVAITVAAGFPPTKTVTLNLREQRLDDILGAICRQVGAEIEVGAGGVGIVPAAPPPKPLAELQRQNPAIVAKLRAVRFPRVDFSGERLMAAVNTLAEMTRQAPDGRGVNFQIIPFVKPPANPPVTVQARDISLAELLDRICASANCRYGVIGNIVTLYDGPPLVLPPDDPAGLPVPPLDLGQLRVGAGFRTQAYLEAAAALQKLPPAEALATLRAWLAAQDSAGTKPEVQEPVKLLCVMLFEPGPGQKLRRPAFGQPTLLGHTFTNQTDLDARLRQLPDFPLTFVGDLPFYLVPAGALAGSHQPASAYLDYCELNARWRKHRYAPASPAQLQAAREVLLASPRWPRPLTKEERAFLTAQAPAPAAAE